MEKISTARFNVTFQSFIEIAIDNFLDGNTLYPEYKKNKDEQMNNQNIEPIYLWMQRDIAKYCYVCISFAVMALEGFIYDYAACYFADEYVKNHLDRLDTFSKWVIIPRLVTGKEIDANTKPYKLLKEAIKERNSITHSKSKHFDINKVKISDVEDFLKTAKNSLIAVYELSDFLDNIDKNSAAKFQFGIFNHYPNERNEKWKKVLETGENAF